MEGTELQNKESIRTLKEKQYEKWLGIYETDAIKQRGIKEKITKEKQENFSKTNSAGEI